MEFYKKIRKMALKIANGRLYQLTEGLITIEEYGYFITGLTKRANRLIQNNKKWSAKK